MYTMKTIALFVAALFVFLLLAAIGCNQPKPLQAECVKHTSCFACVSGYCGWCGDPGSCYSFSSEMICVEPTGFVQSCTDGSAPFPGPIVNPMPYAKPRAKDAGSDK